MHRKGRVLSTASLLVFTLAMVLTACHGENSNGALLDRLEESPRDIYLDGTRVDWNDNGRVFISSRGELSTALGLEQGDILVDINGYSFAELLDTARLYFTLRDAPSLHLAIERRGMRMTLSYFIE